MSILHIGDIISLYSDGFLSTLGLVDDRCVLQPNKEDEGTPKCPPKKFRDCLFKVCIQYKYDIQTKLWRSGHIDEELYNKLYAAAKTERDSNTEKSQFKRGTVVKYEDTIQLLHIKSNKFITVNAKAEAPEEKDATKVYLDSNGNEGSWFKVRSPYKYRSNGEDVVCESIALVSDLMRFLGEDVQLYLHASPYTLMDNQDCLEINASTQSTSWDIKPFLDHTEDLEDFLKGGDVVRLFHTDQEKFLTMDTYNTDETQHVFLRSTDRAKATSATSSKALWEVEVVHPDPCRSGIARWNSLIRLKHLATERYLAADLDDDQTSDPMREKLRQKDAPVYKLISIEFSYDYSTLFEFDSTTTNVNENDYVPIHSNVTLKHHPTGTYVHSTNIVIDKDQEKSCMSKVGCAQHKGFDEVFAVIPVLATEIRDLDFVYDACIILNECCDDLMRDRESTGSEYENLRIEAHRKLSQLLPEIIHFIANKEHEPRKIEKALAMIVSDSNRERQKLLREQNVLKLLFDILELEDKSYYQEKHSNYNKKYIQCNPRDLNPDICRLCYKVLRLSFQNYRKNQEYVCKQDKFIKKQFGKDISAELTYSSLFHSNKNILEKCVNSKDIGLFVDLIRMKRQSSFLDCLADLCILSNKSVSAKIQSIVCEHITSQYNCDILIITSLSSSTSNNRDETIYLSTEHWRMDDWWSETIYGGKVEHFCTIKALKDIVSGALMGNPSDLFLLDYYKHQLDLFSALCVDRHTSAGDYILSRLPSELMLRCIANHELPSDLRASFCRLMLHSYVNKEPQRIISPVRLRRNWLEAQEKVTLSVYDSTMHHVDKSTTQGNFENLMQFVEQYLHNLTSTFNRSSKFSNNERNKLTYEVINLNRELTYFGFYKLSDFLRLSKMLLIVLDDDKNQQPLVMRTKTKIIEILHYMSEVQLDYMITCLLSIFKSNQHKPPVPTSAVLNPSSAQTQHQLNQEQPQRKQSSSSATSQTTSPSSSSSSSMSSSSQIAIKTNQALGRHLQDIDLDCKHSVMFVNTLLELVKHDCPDLVSASLKLLLNYRLLRNRILETFRRVELTEAPCQVRDNFRKLHPLIERSDKYIRRNSDDNHLLVNQVLLGDTKLISYIVQHVQYLIGNKDEEHLTIDLLRLLKELIPFEEFNQSVSLLAYTNNSTQSTQTDRKANHDQQQEQHTQHKQQREPSSKSSYALDSSQPGLSTGSSMSNSNTNHQSANQGKNSNLSHAQLGFNLQMIQNRLDAQGASNLVIELIAMGSSMSEEKIRDRSGRAFKDTLALGIALLEGGNQQVQASIHDKLARKSDKSERFFEVLSNRIGLAQQQLSPSSVNKQPGSAFGSLTNLAGVKYVQVANNELSASTNRHQINSTTSQTRLRRSNLLKSQLDGSSLSIQASTPRLLRQLSSTASEKLQVNESLRKEIESTVEATQTALDKTRTNSVNTMPSFCTFGGQSTIPDIIHHNDDVGASLLDTMGDSGYSATPSPIDNSTSTTSTSSSNRQLRRQASEQSSPLGANTTTSSSNRLNTTHSLSLASSFNSSSNQNNYLNHATSTTDRPNLSDNIKIMRPILRFLQLLCEDHNINMQTYMQSQKNKTSYNLVAKTLVFLNCICGSKEGSLGHKLGEYIKENNVDLINQTLRTLTEYCQGPCIENQRCILMHESNGIDMIRSLILDKIEPLDNLRMDLVLELKDNACKLLLALMESCSDSQHASRIIREPTLIKKLVDVAIVYYHEQDDYDDCFAELSCEEMISSTDGMVRPRDVGHKVFILCLQLVQQLNSAITPTTPTTPSSLKVLPAAATSNSIGGHHHQHVQHAANSQLPAKIPSSEEARLAAERCEPREREWFLREATALQHYESNTAQIEIVRQNRLIERVVFPVPQICEYLTLETKRSVYQNTDQDEHGSKVPDFVQKVDDLFDEMKWQRELIGKPISHTIARHMSLFSSTEFKLSCLVTLLLLFVSPNARQGINMSAHNTAHSPMVFSTSNLLTTLMAMIVSTKYFFLINIPYSWTIMLLCSTVISVDWVGTWGTLKLFGLMLEFVSVLHLSSVLINKGIVNKPLRVICQESDVIYHAGQLMNCTLGLLCSPLFYPFWLPISLIRREETLRNVIQAVTKNAYSIFMTVTLGIIIILEFAVINYLYLGDELVIDLEDGTQYKPCSGNSTLGECLCILVDYGLRSGGGIGDRIRDTPMDFSLFRVSKFFVVLAFFLIVNLAILQMVFGIVIDTFGELRDEKQRKEKILKNTCFICGLDRSSFENQAPTFEEHIRSEHNLWHYLYFIVLIKTKKRTELSGPESFVYDMLSNKDNSWFPWKRALSLDVD